MNVTPWRERQSCDVGSRMNTGEVPHSCPMILRMILSASEFACERGNWCALEGLDRLRSVHEQMERRGLNFGNACAPQRVSLGRRRLLLWSYACMKRDV